MPKKSFAPASKPTLESVLEHYGVDFREKQGGQKILCPVHSDRKPSLSLDLSKGLWNCQSCEAQGDSWSLLMKMESCDFRTAVGLADKLGLDRVDGSGAADGRRGSVRQRVRSVYAGQAADEDRTPYVPSWKK